MNQTYLERIRQVDPFVKSIAQLNPDAVAEAVVRDGERRDGCVRGYERGSYIFDAI